MLLTHQIMSRNAHNNSPTVVTNPDANRLYEAFFQGKLDSLRKEIAELNVEAAMRKAIHNQPVEELDHQVLSASIFLNDLKHWAIGYRTGVDIERNFWERRIAELTKEKRGE